MRTENKQFMHRGEYWFSLLTQNMTLRQGLCPSVNVADGLFKGKPASVITVVPDEQNQYPRAKHGEVGLLEGWTLAKAINEIIQQDAALNEKRAIIAVIDVPSQAYGRREEAFGIHQALAGAAGAYANARLQGHPIVGLMVGKAMSGAFLAHGYQANQIIAFDDPNVMTHAMGKESAARITLRSVDALEKLAKTIPPMAYDIKQFATLGILSKLMTISHPDHASENDVKTVQTELSQAIERARQQGVYLSHRLDGENRKSSKLVRERMRQEW